MNAFNKHFYVKAKDVGYYKPALRYIRTGINGSLLDSELVITIGMQILKQNFPDTWEEAVEEIYKKIKEE